MAGRIDLAADNLAARPARINFLVTIPTILFAAAPRSNLSAFIMKYYLEHGLPDDHDRTLSKKRSTTEKKSACLGKNSK
jgi:hypothetical protein